MVACADSGMIDEDDMNFLCEVSAVEVIETMVAALGGNGALQVTNRSSMTCMLLARELEQGCGLTRRLVMVLVLDV